MSGGILILSFLRCALHQKGTAQEERFYHDKVVSCIKRSFGLLYGEPTADLFWKTFPDAVRDGLGKWCYNPPPDIPIAWLIDKDGRKSDPIY